MPGLVNARTRIASRAPREARDSRPRPALLSIANMLKAGITCFCDVGYFPREVATPRSQGMRAAIGLPVAEHPSPWAQNAGEYLTRALRLRDDYKGHPSISTSFAPLRPARDQRRHLCRASRTLAERTRRRHCACHCMSRRATSTNRSCATDCGRSSACDRLGLLTPALTAAHVHVLGAADIDLAQRGGIGVTLCLESDLPRGAGLPPIAALPSGCVWASAATAPPERARTFGAK